MGFPHVWKSTVGVLFHFTQIKAEPLLQEVRLQAPRRKWPGVRKNGKQLELQNNTSKGEGPEIQQGNPSCAPDGGVPLLKSVGHGHGY